MKIILLGNAGAGKSTMAKRLVRSQEIAHLSLDEVAWNADVQRKPFAESVDLIQAFLRQHDQWIIEGCYGDLIEAILPYCEELRFLNPGVDVCVSHCLNRPWEPEKFSSPEAQQVMLNNLINWVKDYETRQDEFGLQRHRKIFDRFQGKKQEYSSVEKYDADTDTGKLL